MFYLAAIGASSKKKNDHKKESENKEVKVKRVKVRKIKRVEAVMKQYVKSLSNLQG
jgi:hypothetical protein